MSQQDSGIIFSLMADTDLMVHVNDGTKTPLCFANLACFAAKTAGLTELSLEDHNVAQAFEGEAIHGAGYDVHIKLLLFLLLPFHGCFVFFCLIFLGPKSFAFSVYFFHFWSQDQTPIPFRYTLTHSSKISFFEPKKLANNDDRDLRYSMFGAVYLKHENGLKAVPKTTRASTLWEASYIES